ncbi:hypothetical protein TNCV_4615241 [Trichonephila clavipes]|nr:hypothetical protein TNCV_4615241 [Trichonephila clavipes]
MSDRKALRSPRIKAESEGEKLCVRESIWSTVIQFYLSPRSKADLESANSPSTRRGITESEPFLRILEFGLWCQYDWTYNSLVILLWTRLLPRQLTVALHTQWRIVIKGGKTVTVCRRGLAVEETKGEDDWRIMHQWALMS